MLGAGGRFGGNASASRPEDGASLFARIHNNLTLDGYNNPMTKERQPHAPDDARQHARAGRAFTLIGYYRNDAQSSPSSTHPRPL